MHRTLAAPCLLCLGASIATGIIGGAGGCASYSSGLGFGKPPITFVQTADESGNWRTIEFRDGLTKDNVWPYIVDALAMKYDLEICQADSGYVRSSWKFTNFTRAQGGIYRYRSRVTVKVNTTSWTQLKVKNDSQWLSRKGWLLGYDTEIVEDVYGALQGAVGRAVR